MYSPQFLVAALVAASATLTGASKIHSIPDALSRIMSNKIKTVSLEPRQSSIACNVARFQIVKALGDTKSAVGDIQDPTVQEAAAAGVKTAQGGILQVAQSLFSGAAPSADGRTAVESGLNATSAALAGGDT